MKVTIIPDDKFVSVDGVGYNVSMASVPSIIHAVQWDGASGWIEYKDGAAGKPGNKEIDSIDEFEPVLALWKEADDAAKAPPPPPTPEELKVQAEAKRVAAYRNEADPLYFKAQRGEATMEEWLAKVEEIKARYPYPAA